MKWLVLWIILMCWHKSFSQELNYSCQQGYALGETNAYKKIMLFSANTVGYECQLKNDYFFSLAIGAAAFKFSYTDTGNMNVFKSRYCIAVPVGIKRYFFINASSNFFISIGTVFSYCIVEKKLLQKPNFNEKIMEHNLGCDIALEGSVCYKRMISIRTSFAIGFSKQQNFIISYKKEADKIKIYTSALSLSLYHKLGKQ